MDTHTIKRKKYKRTNVYPFLHRMYTLFNTRPDIFVLKKIRLYEGEYDPVNDVINIDYRKELISTLVHEVLHYLYIKWPEQRVRTQEQKIMNSLSVRQVRNILKRFSQFL